MHRDRAESAGKAHRRGHHHLYYRTPKPSEVIHGLITSLAAMRWPIATGSSMRTVTFQIDDELMRASLYKGRLIRSSWNRKVRPSTMAAPCVPRSPEPSPPDCARTAIPAPPQHKICSF